MITPTVLLTAAHCFSVDWRRFEVHAQPPVTPIPIDPEDFQVHSPRECFVHPDAIRADLVEGPVESCDEAQGLGADITDFAQRADIGALRIGSAFESLTPRDFGPPTACLADGSTPIMLRGFRSYPIRRRTQLTGQVPTADTFLMTFAEAGLVQEGDSGGTIEAADGFADDPIDPPLDDTTDPMLGVFHRGDPSGQAVLLWGNEAADPDPIVWLWDDVLAPSGDCDFGSGDSDCTIPGRSGPLPDDDGDGLPNSRDLCPQVDLVDADEVCDGQHCDADRDWVGDECDNCPTAAPGSSGTSCDHDQTIFVSVPGEPEPVAVTDPDADGDGAFNHCDLCPEQPPGPETGDVCTPEPGRIHCDRDSDNLGDECDNCPRADNPDQTDSTEEAVGTPFDGAGDACDNCPAEFNPSQLNCNIDSERELGIFDPEVEGPLDVFQPGVGDACDPIECADTRIESESDPGGPLLVGRGEVFIDALSEDVKDARAGFRFCRCPLSDAGSSGEFDIGDTLEHRTRCAEGFDCQLNAIADYDALIRDTAAENRNETSWRLVTLNFLAPDEDEEPGRFLRDDPLTQEVSFQYSETIESPLFDADGNASWSRMADQERWTTPRNDIDGDGDVDADDAPYLDDPPFGDVPGVLWTHTPGLAESLLPEFPRNRRDRTNHYWSGVASEPLFVDPGIFEDITKPIGPVVRITRREICPTCLAFPVPFFAMAGDESPSIMFAQGGLPASNLFVPGAEDAFAAAGDDAQWLAMDESRPWIPEGGARYVALSPDGTTIRACLLGTPSGLAPPGHQPPGEIPPPQEVVLSETQDGQAPPPRQGAHATLSARRSQLWLVGGRAEDRTPVRDVWRYNILTGRWQRLPLPSDIRPHDPVAVTYSAAEDAVWVLDLVRTRGRARERLLKLDANGAGGVAVASWPRRARRTQYAMAAGPHGALYVVASRDDTGPHFVRRITVQRERARIVRHAVGEGALGSTDAYASRRGLTVFVRRGGRIVPVGYGNDELRPAAAAVERASDDRRALPDRPGRRPGSGR